MSGSRTVTFLSGALFLCSIAGSVSLLRKVDSIKTGGTLQEVLYISSPKVLKRLSLGYDGLLADIYWTRAVQYFGGHRTQSETQYRLLAPLLEITTTLDPHLVVAYQFGSSFLSTKPPNGAGEPKKAVELVEYGIRNNPNEWRLYYNLGFIHYMELKDYAKAADAFARGSRVPNAHPFLKVLAANMAQHAGDAQMARALWTTTYQSSTNKLIRANALAHLRALQVDEEIGALETVIARYQLSTGRVPGSFSDLVKIGELPAVPGDPLGNPYRLTEDGRVVVSDPEKLPFIKTGLPLGYQPPARPKLPVD